MKKYWQSFYLLLFALLGTSCATNAQEQSRVGQNLDSSQGSNAMAASNFSPNQNKPVNWEAKLDNKYFVPNGNKKEIYVYVELQGGENKQDKARAPLNLSLVVDRSGSMSGDKLKYAKQAMDFVIDQLGSEDYLSMVQYNSDVQVLQTSEMVQDKRALHQKVDKIRDGGSTNLCGGMQEGYVQVRSTKKQGYINRVLLLSDGNVTAGISDPKQITKIAENQFKENGVAISTFGVGSDYNENLMTDISEAGGANYYFIGTPDQIPTIFAKELQGLLAVVGQSVKLKVKFPTKNLKCVKAYGYPFTVFGDEVFVDFNDVFSKEEKGVLLKFEVIEPLTDDISFDCEMRYTDVATKKDYSENQKLKLILTRDEKMFSENVDSKVKENIVLFESTEMFDEALKEADKGNYEKAKELSEKTAKYLESNKSKDFSPRFEQQTSNVLKYDKEVETMKSRPVEEQQMMQKSSKNLNYEIKKKK